MTKNLSRDSGSLPLTEQVNLFWGNGAVASFPGDGMVRGWNWLKAQTGNTHPGALLPCGWVSVCPYSGAYASGYGKNGISGEGPGPQVYDRLTAWGITHFHPIGTGNVRCFYNYFLCTPSSPGADLSKVSDLTGEEAHPGYFRGTLKQYGVDFELTCTAWAACHRYQFHAGKGHLTVDCNAIGLRIHSAWCPTEKIDSCSAYRTAPGCWRGFVTAHGTTIHFALLVKGEIAYSELNNGVIAYDFATGSAEITLGFSMLDGDHAEAHARTAAELGFDKVHQAAEAEWNAQLNCIEAHFATEAERRRFYSILYHSFTKPCWHDAGYTDFSTMWDMYRTQLPLVLSFSPAHARRMLLAMLETIEKLGRFPIFYYMNSALDVESGQASALVVYTLCDGFTRGLLTAADYPRVKAALQQEFAQAQWQGKSPTHILDLAGAYEAARIIAELGHDSEFAAAMKAQSALWRKAYDPATGYLIADAVYYEGDYRNYSFRPHVDMEQRIALAGGPEKFLAMLDEFFAVHYTTDKPFAREPRIGYFEGLNNETDMETPYTYLWCGRPDRLALILDTIRRLQFTDGEGGAPGNVDSGALASWYIWACLGIYPLTGAEYYLLGSPSVTEATLHLTHGDLHISVARESADAIEPERIEFNGRAITDWKIPVRELEQGGELKFYLKRRA